MKSRSAGALAVGLAAASLLTLGTLSQTFADDHVNGTGTKVVSGCGDLSVSGSGTAHLTMDGDATVTVNGQVRVNGDSSQVSVDTSGQWTRNGLAGNDVQYDGNGTLHIHGSGIVADVSGANGSINGNGCGTVTLNGTGSASWSGTADTNANGNLNHNGNANGNDNHN